VLDALLRTPRYQSLVLDDAMAVYAPPHENDTTRYQRFLRDQTDLPGTTPLSDLSADQLRDVTTAIRRFEGWHEGTVVIQRQP
jgi:hypothetical protein